MKPPDDGLPPVSPQNAWKGRLLIYGPFVSGLLLMALYLGLKYAALHGTGKIPFEAMLYAIGMVLSLFGSIPVVVLAVVQLLHTGARKPQTWLIQSVSIIAILVILTGLGNVYEKVDDHLTQSALRDLGIDACFPVFERERYDMKGHWSYKLRGSGPSNELVILHIKRNDNGELLVGDTVCVRYLPAYRGIVEEKDIRENPAARILGTATQR